MALVQKRSRRTAAMLIILGVVAVGALGYYLLPKLFPASGGEIQGPGSSLNSQKIITNFGEAVLTDPRFQALQSYGDLPVKVDLSQVGRPNPFAPLP